MNPLLQIICLGFLGFAPLIVTVFIAYWLLISDEILLSLGVLSIAFLGFVYWFKTISLVWQAIGGG